VTGSGSDVRAILAELDLRLRELEEELASVGAAPPPQAGGTAAPAPDAPPEPPPPPGPPTRPGAPAPPEPARAREPADDAAAALEAIRGAVPNAVEVVARAPDALVLRVELAAGHVPAGAERPGGEDFEAGR